MKPLVSICTPNYNCGKYIAKAIKSALNQSYKNIEIIIVDNRSTDNSWNIIKSFKKKRIYIYKNKFNLGPPANFNECIKKSKGKYIIFLAADDLLEKNAVEKEVKVMEKNKNVGLVHGCVSVIDENDKEKYSLPFSNKDIIISGKKKLTQLLKGNHIAFPSVMIRKECFDKVGIFDPEIRYCIDWNMWMRICLKYNVAYLKDIIAFYRLYEESSGHDYERTRVASIEQYLCFNKIFKLIKDKKILRKKDYYYYLLAREQIVRGMQLTIKGKSKHARKYISTAPLIHNSWKLIFTFPFFYFLTYTGKYPAKLFLKLGKMLTKD